MHQIQFIGHNIEVTQALRDITCDKFKRLERYADKIDSIHVTFNIDKILQKAEAKIHLPGIEIFAHAKSEDMYKTIGILANKLIRQLNKHKRGQQQ
jgi:putative sigma-54 modulation protein